MLSMGSPVFRAMFSHETEEINENPVQIKDIWFETMNKLLHFLYTGTISDDMVNEELLMAADKYQISRLKAICENVITKSLDATNALNTVIATQLYGSEAFKNVCITVLAKHWENIDKVEKTSATENYPDLMVSIFDKIAET